MNKNLINQNCECLIKDFEMLMDGSWEPDNDSILCSIENLMEIKNEVNNNERGVDNFDLIKPLLKFESDGDDFYYLQILQRKKENAQLGSNSRVIKNYYINNLEYLENRYDEIKELCNMFNARAMLRLNKRSHKKVAFRTMINIANTISNSEFHFIKKSYDRACGETHNDKNKKWILDFDTKHISKDQLSDIYNHINNCEPAGPKILASIPSKNGFHLITNPFNLMEFDSLPVLIEKPEIHKDNPINLYIP